MSAEVSEEVSGGREKGEGGKGEMGDGRREVGLH